jgi:CHAT domain-containing protein
VYHSILSLLSYVEKSYATDDAKIFIKKKTSEAYRKAFEVCLRIYATNGDAHMLREAFLVSEKNKASIISSSLNERKISVPGHEEWMVEERNIKHNIARLNIVASASNDSRTLQETEKQKASYEIRLQELQKKIEENDRYYQLKYTDNALPLEEIQERLKHDQALISFYQVSGTLHSFLVTGNSFEHLEIDSFANLEKDIASWLEAIQTTENGKKFTADKIGQIISAKLLGPLLQMLDNKQEWIIVPDGILSFLPFESLPLGKSWLVESKAISYLFSSRFLPGKLQSATLTVNQPAVLAFAPFTKENNTLFSSLDYSASEIQGLNGKKLLDSQATKEEFLKDINHFPIVHLATHARSDLNSVADSWVAFYPKNISNQQNKLYLEELYGLNMENTELMVISACETGKGEFVSNEGVISIARAFTYAGCSSVINSLWKADDKATAEILKDFYVYLKRGLSKSKALQQAKLDYIHSNAIHKTPEYWSHLILIGNSDPVFTRAKTWMIAMAGGGMLLAGLLLMTLKKEKKVDVFKDNGSQLN